MAWTEAVARATGRTDLGGFLDIVPDFIFYGAVPIAFAPNNPENNALPAAVLLSSYLANGSTFLTYANMAQKRETVTTAQGVNTFVAIALFCMFLTFFDVIAYVFAVLGYISAVGRLNFACHTLRQNFEKYPYSLFNQSCDTAASNELLASRLRRHACQCKKTE